MLRIIKTFFCHFSCFRERSLFTAGGGAVQICKSCALKTPPLGTRVLHSPPLEPLHWNFAPPYPSVSIHLHVNLLEVMAVMSALHTRFQVGARDRGWKVRPRQRPHARQGYGCCDKPYKDLFLEVQGAKPPEALIFSVCKALIIPQRHTNFVHKMWKHIFTLPPTCKYVSQQIYTDLRNDTIWSPMGWIQSTGWEIGTMLHIMPKWPSTLGTLAKVVVLYWIPSSGLHIRGSKIF